MPELPKVGEYFDVKIPLAIHPLNFIVSCCSHLNVVPPVEQCYSKYGAKISTCTLQPEELQFWFYYF